jgi:hypothetical protein
MLAIPNVSSKFCDVWQGDEAHLARLGEDHLGPVAEKADKPGHANPLSLQRHFTAPAEAAHRLSAADAIATFELYIVSSTGWGTYIHVAKGLRSR